MTAGASGTARRAPRWSSIALTLGQLALMGSNLVLSLALAYAGGLSVVGATAPAVLVFQLTCGVVQRAVAEAALLSVADEHVRAERSMCQRAVAVALLGGLAGAIVAFGASIAVPQPIPLLALAYAAGIPFSIALDIGRSAGVAAGAARSTAFETVAWAITQTALTLLFAAMHSPLGICVSTAVVNAAFFLLAMAKPVRRPRFRGVAAWIRSDRASFGAAASDALLNGLTPVLAMQAASFTTTAATVGVIRVLQQVFAPLSFIAISVRRVLIYRRSSQAASTVRQDLRDGLIAAAFMVAGSIVLGTAVILARWLLPALAFIPVGVVLVAAGLEKIALGLSFGCSLSRFIRGEFGALLPARYFMLGMTVVLSPALAHWWGAAGYLFGSSAALIAYSLLVLIPRRESERPRGYVPMHAPRRGRVRTPS